MGGYMYIIIDDFMRYMVTFSQQDYSA